ncbi:biotin transporter BioY [Myxococcus virescens]|uniref:Biotin transporter n=1 Tax=Myxococcus virescens TaxID=83456 RepID=A0A511HEM1_9BACT|nr:biotin transporter BioY [Myxococcus virescens]GEL72008.1 biotin biosynthesis protein BioY [Myxococcus virescens]SDE00456.1 biotin transport system substrate-specific component [Myxococcus virescens]
MSVYPSGAPCPRGVRFWRLRLTLAATARPRPHVLADTLARSRAHDVALVLGGALLTAGLAQVSISVPGSPVPITGQSLGVIVAAAALGPVRGMAAQLLYLLMGAAGLPFFAEGASGLERILGATGGYLVGFVPAAFLVGLAAQRGFDRRPWTALPLFAVGQLAVFAVGLPWLVLSARLGVAKAVGVGFTPFLPGGLLKAAIAAVLLPLAWRLVGPRKV